MSGGMRQRAMIALALACNPQVLADEPTTALDATVQIQILLLLRELQRELGLSIVFVTHDIGAAVEVADRIAVMYAGRIVEEGTAREADPRPAPPLHHAPCCMSRAHGAMERGAPLQTMAGAPPDLTALPGCAFAARCRLADACRASVPEAVELAPGHVVRCLRLAGPPPPSSEPRPPAMPARSLPRLPPLPRRSGAPCRHRPGSACPSA
jgi:peptide/nickel transport system ATP-binding protein